MILFISSLIFTFFISYFFYKIAKKFQIFDLPNSRKLHDGKIPIVGGISIYFVILIYVIFIDLSEEALLVIFLSSFIILLIGFIDDIKQLHPYIRIFFQFIASIPIIIFGFSFEYNICVVISILKIITSNLFILYICAFSSEFKNMKLCCSQSLDLSCSSYYPCCIVYLS